MIYKDFGKTGVKVSVLGFGTIRLPEFQKDEKWFIDEEKTTEMVRKAFEQGINYFDMGYEYCHGNGEVTIGKAIKGIRDKIYLSTKLPMWNVKEKDDFRRFLEKQLVRLDTEYIDFYHFHSLNRDYYNNKVIDFDLIEEMYKAKNEGSIKHISFSFHDKPEVIKEFVDTGYFETLLCQYNLIDRSNEDSIAYAAEKGIGVVVMGPVAGGRLTGPSEVLEQKKDDKIMKTSEVALRFVLSNPNVTCVLSGMETLEMIEENAKLASGDLKLSQEMNRNIKELYEKTKKLEDIYCTGCKYCLPCTEGINIPRVFKILINHDVYGLKELAGKEYIELQKNEKPDNQQPSKCSECGICETKCPQSIKIMEQLKHAVNVLDNKI